MTDPIKTRGRRDVPRLDEINGCLVSFEVIKFEMVRSPFPDHGQVERAQCRIYVLDPPLSNRHMAVEVDGLTRVVPAAFGTVERPAFVSSRGILAACHDRSPAMGRLFRTEAQGAHDRRHWWVLDPIGSAAERELAETMMIRLTDPITLYFGTDSGKCFLTHVHTVNAIDYHEAGCRVAHVVAREVLRGSQLCACGSDHALLRADQGLS
jgi:hypothetical protein